MRQEPQGVADPLDMVIFLSNEDALFGGNNLKPIEERLWTLKQ
jgi:hypothetical protein